MEQPGDSQSNYDIAIVGGGMVGISLALLLAAQTNPWKILLIEAHPYQRDTSPDYRPSFDARSTALSWSSRQIYQNVGLWNSIAQHACPIRQIHVSDRGHVGLARIDAREAGVDALGYVVENRWLGMQLLNALFERNIDVLAPARVAGVQLLRNGVNVSVDGMGQGVHARLLVVADGANSETAQKLGIRSETRGYGQSAVIANVGLASPHDNIAYERFTDEGPLALLPLPDFEGMPRAALVWTQKQSDTDNLLSSGDEDFLGCLRSRFGDRVGGFTQVGERFAYPLALILSGEQVRSNLAVLGNAAHSLHPVAGQGFNLSLRDAAQFAQVLDEASSEGDDFSSLQVLERYLLRQKTDQANTVLFSDSLPRLFGLKTPPIALARNVGLVVMDLLPPLRSRFARFGMGLANREARLG